MKIATALLGLTAAASLMGAAHADPLSAAAEPRAAQPWYDRFTYSSQLATATAGWSEQEVNAALAWRPNARWGVKLEVQEERAAEHAPLANRDETSVQAFYQFTPRLRVGGAVSVAREAARRPLDVGGGPEAEPSAGIKLESAFRF